MEITKEYFDEKFGYINGKFDEINRQFFAVGERMGQMQAELKAEFKREIGSAITASETEMKKFIIQGFEQHQTWVREEFKTWLEPYDDRITKVELDVAELKLNKKALA